MDLYPIKAQYLTNEEVILRLEIDRKIFYKVILNVYRINDLVYQKELILEEDITDLSISTYDTEFAGYGVEAHLFGNHGATLIETAFDVVNSPKKSLRYGFLSDFTSNDLNNGAVEQLRKYHINMVQYYDWSYRHDHLVSPIDNYVDMMGKEIDLNTVRKKIDSAKSYGMESIGYGAIYAASKEFYEKHKDWALYNGLQDVFCFIDVFYIMNIAAKSPWNEHLINQYKEAIEKVGFSGIHMDTYGFPKTAFSHLHTEPEIISLDKEFPGLIEQTRKELSKVKEDTYLIFNNVGNWPASITAKSSVDAVYVEVWNPYDRYFHLKQIIEEARRACDVDKSIILAAYLAPFRLESLEKASYAAYLITAVIVSNGAYHMLLGEKNAVLTQGYYGDYSLMNDEVAHNMRKYYDFMIRYLELFYDSSLEDVSMTHIGWDNYEYQCQFSNWSSWGEADKIWITIRQNERYKCIYLINLCGNKEDFWNCGKETPDVQRDLTFKVHVDYDIQGVYYASPDRESNQSYSLMYTYEENEKGKFVKFTLPELHVWSVVYLKL